MQRVGVEDMPLQQPQTQTLQTRRNSQAQTLKNLAFHNNSTSRKRNIEDASDFGVAAQLPNKNNNHNTNVDHDDNFERSTMTMDKAKLNNHEGREREFKEKKKLFRNQEIRNSYQSLDHSSAIQGIDQQQQQMMLVSKKVFSQHRKSQVVLQPTNALNSLAKHDRERRKTGRMVENDNKNHHTKEPSFVDDQQFMMGTINTDVFSESRRQQRLKQSQKNEDTLKSNNKFGISLNYADQTNINSSTRIHNDLHQSIRSSKSQHEIKGLYKSNLAQKYQQQDTEDNTIIKDKRRHSKHHKQQSYRNQESDNIHNVDYETSQREDRIISPTLRAKINLKNAKSDYKQQKHEKVKSSFKDEYELHVEESPSAGRGGHKRKISNFNVKKVHLSQLASPIAGRDKLLTSRPQGLISGDLRVQKHHPKQDSDHEKSRDSTQKRLKGSMTRKADSRYDLEETKNFSNSKKIFSMIVQDKIIQNNINKTKEDKSKSRIGPQLVSRMGIKFGQMFKLQKKNLNDEGIAGVDEGNINNGDDDIATPFDSQSERNSSDVLQLEYQELKQKLDNMKSQDKQTKLGQSQIANPAIFNSAKNTKEKNERGRKSNLKEHSSGKSKNQAQKRNNKKSQRSDSPQDHIYDRREILSYDDNSFERELIEKLNEESSIHEDTDKSKSQYNQKRGKSQFQKGYYKSGNYKSKSSFHHRRSERQSRQLSSDEQSCSTCNMHKDSEQSYPEIMNQNKRKSSMKKRQKSYGGEQSRKRQSKNTKRKSPSNYQTSGQQQQQFINQFSMQMPLMTMMTPQFNMFGFPLPQLPTTQIMNFQNNFSYQGSQFPLFMPQQQQYFNMMQQQSQQNQQQFPHQYPQSQTEQTSQNNKTPEKTSEEKLKSSRQHDITDHQQNPLLKTNNFYTFNQQSSVPAQNNETLNIQQNPLIAQNVNSNPNQSQNVLSNNHSPLITSVSQNIQDINLLGSQLNSQMMDQSHMKGSHIKNNFSNQTQDSIDNQSRLENNHKLNNMQAQNQSRSNIAEENTKIKQQRLGSPQSNISRMDVQSTNMTGDYQSSVAPSQLALINFNNRRSLNIQTQIKEVNQLYLNKLKDKFQQNTTSQQPDKAQNDYDNSALGQQDKILSPTLVSRNSVGLNQAKSNPLGSDQNYPKSLIDQKPAFTIQPIQQLQPNQQSKQSSTFRPSNLASDSQQRQSSVPPQMSQVRFKNYDSHNNSAAPNQQPVELISQQKLERHRSPQPSENKIFTQHTNERLATYRQGYVNLNQDDDNSSQIKPSQDQEDNYYINNSATQGNSSQKKNSSELIQKADDIQSKLRMLNAKLSQARQESNQSRQIKDIKFVELLSNNDENDDHSPFTLGSDKPDFQVLQKQSRQDTQSQPPDLNRVSYQHQKSTVSQKLQQQQTIRKEQSNSINTSSIVQTRKIQIPQKQNIQQNTRDSHEASQTDLNTATQVKNSKAGLIVIDASPRSSNTQNYPINNRLKKNMVSPGSNLENKHFAFQSDYTGGESMRSSIYLKDEESKTFVNNSAQQKFVQSKLVKQQPKKKPSNTSKQITYIDDFQSSVKHSNNKNSILNSSNTNCLVTMTYDDTNHYQNSNTALNTQRIGNSNNPTLVMQNFNAQNNGLGKGSQSNKHSIINKQLASLTGTQSQDNRRISQKESQQDVFVEIFDKPKRQTLQSSQQLLQQQQQMRTTDNRGKSQINTFSSQSQQMHQQVDNISDNTSNLSLADMFQQKMRQKSIPLNLEKRLTQQQVHSQQMSTIQEKEVKQETKQEKERTKQELLELRKQMMKSKVKEKKDNFAQEPTKDPVTGKPTKDNMPYELMQRLSKGQKVQLDTKEMVKLSHKNYENLPEIKKKKEEERKKEDYKQRQLMVKKYAKELEEKRKQLHVKKQTSQNDKQNDII